MSDRATRPLLTMYVCVSQQNGALDEYHAMFLEALSLNELRKKLSVWCNLSPQQIVAIYRYRTVLTATAATCHLNPFTPRFKCYILPTEMYQ